MKMDKIWIVKGQTSGFVEGQPGGLTEWQFSDGEPGERGYSEDYTCLTQGLLEHLGTPLDLTHADFTADEQRIFDNFMRRHGQ
ncbi:hypothetical protein ACQKOE_07255 [Novosphingobium sp. NPDC080210]|uniref:hypothetical protein n=1 Tax=Novosphingobium sp. NPDC080210 TaxID=3390596 RepID=UPI003CFF5ECE